MPFVFIYGDIEFDDESEEPASKAQDFSYEKPGLGNDAGRASILQETSGGFLSNIFGKPVPSYLKLTKDDEAMLRTFIPALKNAGVARCYLSYDGGNDEGFGTLDRCENGNGKEIAKQDLLSNPAFLAELSAYVDEGLQANRHPIFRVDGQTPDTAKLIGDYLDYELPVVLVSLLIGRGYGTGEYELYGRAVADFETMTITDDPNAPYPHGPSN